MKNEKKSILVVDDDQDTLEFLQILLEKEGYIVWGAKNEQEALERVQNNPDLVLLDVKLPGNSGLEICKKLKGDSQYKHIPIFFTSGLVREEHREQGLQAGAEEYITKLFNINGLLRLISEYL